MPSASVPPKLIVHGTLALAAVFCLVVVAALAADAVQKPPKSPAKARTGEETYSQQCAIVPRRGGTGDRR